VLRTTLEHMQTTRRSQIESRFTCKFCHSVFVLENRYLQHKCKQMKRYEEMQSPDGQAALNYYQLWMRNMKRLPPPAASFLTSKYFRTFITFTQFAKRVDLPRPDKFIWLMVQKEYPPTMWMNDDVYSIYIEFLDLGEQPVDQARRSIDTLITYTDKHEIDLSQVFIEMPMHDIIRMLHTRKLSPWLLLFSKTFKHAIVTRASDEQKIILENLIRPDYWLLQFDKRPQEVATIKRLVVEMGI
jgi:hypothetical protein